MCRKHCLRWKTTRYIIGAQLFVLFYLAYMRYIAKRMQYHLRPANSLVFSDAFHVSGLVSLVPASDLFER